MAKTEKESDAFRHSRPVATIRFFADVEQEGSLDQRGYHTAGIVKANARSRFRIVEQCVDQSVQLTRRNMAVDQSPREQASFALLYLIEHSEEQDVIGFHRHPAARCDSWRRRCFRQATP